MVNVSPIGSAYAEKRTAFGSQRIMLSCPLRYPRLAPTAHWELIAEWRAKQQSTQLLVAFVLHYCLKSKIPAAMILKRRRSIVLVAIVAPAKVIWSCSVA